MIKHISYLKNAKIISKAITNQEGKYSLYEIIFTEKDGSYWRTYVWLENGKISEFNPWIDCTEVEKVIVTTKKEIWCPIGERND